MYVCRVVVFSKTNCIYCEKVKELLDGVRVNYKVVDVEEADENDQYCIQVSHNVHV